MRKLDRRISARILATMETRIARLDDPRSVGKPLKGGLEKLWRYRVGDHRVVCEIQDDRLIILIVEIGHRREIYR